MVIEAEKSQDGSQQAELVVPLRWKASWDQEGLRFQWEPKDRKRRLSQIRWSGRRKLPLCQGRVVLLVLFRLSTHWTRPTHIGEGHLLYSVRRLKCLPHEEPPRHTRIVFNQIPGAP